MVHFGADVAIQVFVLNNPGELFYRNINLQAFIKGVFKILLVFQPKG